jgi:hypothetical protein
VGSIIATLFQSLKLNSSGVNTFIPLCLTPLSVIITVDFGFVLISTTSVWVADMMDRIMVDFPAPLGPYRTILSPFFILSFSIEKEVWRNLNI